MLKIKTCHQIPELTFCHSYSLIPYFFHSYFEPFVTAVVLYCWPHFCRHIFCTVHLVHVQETTKRCDYKLCPLNSDHSSRQNSQQEKWGPLFLLIKTLHFAHRLLNPTQSGGERLWPPLKIKLNNFTTVQTMTAKLKEFPKNYLGSC